VDEIYAELWMRIVDKIYKWLERLIARAKVVIVLDSIPSFSDTVESEGSR
jgi:hypothetical protein